jgi:Ner family transcriptional regulator
MTKRQPIEMDREDIKAAIRKTGITMNELARRNGYSVSAVRMALRRPSPDVEAIVAARIGMLPQEIWPSRYDGDGRSLTGGRRTQRHIIRPARQSHRQKHEAA